MYIYIIKGIENNFYRFIDSFIFFASRGSTDLKEKSRMNS